VYYIDGAWKLEELVKILSEEQKDYVSLNVLPALPDEKGQPASTSAVAGTGFAMNTKLEAAQADIAWDWIWTYSGPIGAKVHLEEGVIPAYKIDASGLQLDPLTQKQIAFETSVPMGYVIDNMMDGEGMGILHPLIQEMMFGTKTAEEVAATYEEWVSENDSGRK
ncbi:MAG: carbohydrate ABC transporter substrate-binding protein, partial [Spirochaetota bacterium]